MATAVPVLNEFIEAELQQEIHEVPQKSLSPKVVGLLNEMFRSALREHGEASPMPLTASAISAK